MNSVRAPIVCLLTAIGLAACVARGDAKVETTDIGLNGKAVGISISPHLKHIALLSQQGSRYSLYMDGTAGPRIEALYWTNGTFFNASSAGGWVGQIPVLFDDTGEHWTYCYKAGADTVIMLDGKELVRGPMQPNLAMPLTFSRGGKYLAWGFGHNIYVDGKPGPESRALPRLIFSPDGTHYAYTDEEEGSPSKWAVVDGKQVNFFGDIDQFAANNHLLSIVHDNANHAAIFVMDGKPRFKAANVGKIWTSADGKEIAMIITPAPNAKPILTVNGKTVPAAEGAFVQSVFFSPDGKRYAAHCQAGNDQFMIVDGKKGDVYNSIPEQVGPYNRTQLMWIDPSIELKWADVPKAPAFTSDSSKFVYIASANNSNYLMTEDGEYDDFTGSPGQTELAFSGSGGHYGFLGMAPNHKQAVVIDGKSTVLGQAGGAGQLMLSGLSFSPDGAHYGVVVGSGISSLYVDGKQMPGNIMGQKYIFSPDGKHVLYEAGNSAMAMDGKIIPTDPPFQAASFPFFSPDSQHVYWIHTGRIPNTTDTQELFVDGKPVAHFNDLGLGHGLTLDYTITPNGVLTFITRTENNLTRFVVTPDSNIDAMLAGAKPAPVQS
jgi:hypothetical protein